MYCIENRTHHGKTCAKDANANFNSRPDYGGCIVV